MRKSILLLLLLPSIFLTVRSAAAGEDTIVIVSHNAVHMNYYGNFDAWAVFPDTTHHYRKIILQYILGCPTGGCSAWDYTTQVYAEHHPNDSSQMIPVELGRVITPYAGGFALSWNDTYTFDITDNA